MTRRWSTALLAMLLSACAGVVGLFASKEDQIKIPHARHAKADVECGACHETIFDSTALNTRDMPTEKKCLGCHAKEKEAGNCGFCHTNPEKPAAVPTRARELKMNHATHIELTKEDCGVCHQQLPEPLFTAGLAPTMASCLGCHEHKEQYAAGNCEVCHTDLTRYPLQPISDFSHRGPDFLKDHGRDARSNPRVCANCHQQDFCGACHAKTEGVRADVVLAERTDRAFIHRLDFFSRHAVEARANEASCLNCHGSNSCNSCHAKSGVGGPKASFDPHPPGFGQGAAHGAAARRDIVSCAACHDQGAASNCVSCHKVGGVGGTPHPPTWLLRHGKEEIGKNAMCQTCHL